MKFVSSLLLLVSSSSFYLYDVSAFQITPPRHVSSNTLTIATKQLTNNKTSSSSTTLYMAFETTKEVIKDAEDRMNKSSDSVTKNLGTIRAGRAQPAMLDRVQVDYYGAMTPLNQLATITASNSQQLAVEPYDKSSLKNIEKAIVESDLGLTPNNDGSMIRLNIPPITEDRRKDLLKKVKAIGEEGKVAVRNVRRDCVDAVKKMEKGATISEDESKITQDKLQKLTDKSIKDIDGLISKKEKEVMTV